MAQINSELPNCMLSENISLNDYDFVLFHLYESNEEYKQFYKTMRLEHPERKMIFDNSAYEYFVQGKTLDMDKYVDAICDLCPDFYILPDVLQDKDKTLNGINTFINKYRSTMDTLLSSFKCKPLMVAQGKTSEDLVECLEIFRDRGFENICLPFHIPFYTQGTYDQDIESEFMEVYKKETEDIRYAMGRVRWIRQHEELLKNFHYIHMLGSHCPMEVMFYKDYDSMDTGYPVKCAICYERLGEEKKKPDVIIDDFLNTDLNELIKELIRENIRIYKQFS